MEGLKAARIAVGSLNPVKVDAVRAAAAIFPEAQVQGVEVESGVSAQPWSDEEALRGAHNRARAAMAAREADLGVGIESGLAQVADGVYGFTWVVVMARDGRVGQACSARFQLPQRVLDELREGGELDRAMHRVAGVVELGRAGGAMGLLTDGRVTRLDAALQALHFAFARFLPSSLYDD